MFNVLFHVAQCCLGQGLGLRLIGGLGLDPAPPHELLVLHIGLSHIFWQDYCSIVAHNRARFHEVTGQSSPSLPPGMKRKQLLPKTCLFHVQCPFPFSDSPLLTGKIHVWSDLFFLFF